MYVSFYNHSNASLSTTMFYCTGHNNISVNIHVVMET